MDATWVVHNRTPTAKGYNSKRQFHFQVGKNSKNRKPLKEDETTHFLNVYFGHQKRHHTVFDFDDKDLQTRSKHYTAWTAQTRFEITISLIFKHINKYYNHILSPKTVVKIV